ncbi:hypothetical protein Tco_1243974 [Tanacetum coccineum]
MSLVTPSGIQHSAATQIWGCYKSGFIRGPGDDQKPLAFSFHDKYKQGLMLSVLRSLSKEYVKRSGIKAGTSPSSNSPSAKPVDESREPNDPHGYAESRVKDRVRKSSSLQLCMQLNKLSPNFGCEPVDSSKNDSGNIWDYSDNEAAPASSWSALPKMYELFFICMHRADSYA